MLWWLLWIVGLLVALRLFKWLTSGRCYADTVMTGKVVIVTGTGSGGVGLETAVDLAKRGARVILGCRSRARGTEAVAYVVGKSENDSVRYCHLDLASLESVRRFADEVIRSEARLDVLVNNADVVCTEREYTLDGILKDMQINHFGPFLLTVLLAPLLKASEPSRVLVVSSAWHRLGRVDDLNSKKHGYIQSYANSKLCNILFAKELARRLRGTGVVVNSLNPGLINTSLYRSSTVLERVRGLLLCAFFKSPVEGAQTSIQLAVSNDCDQATGGYYEDCRKVAASPIADDKQVAAELWTLSEDLVKLAPGERI